MRGAALISIVCVAAAGCTLLVDSNGLSETSDPPQTDASSGDGSSGSGTGDASGNRETSTTGQTSGPVSTGLSPTAKVNCAGGKFDCKPPGEACCLIFGDEIDFCVDTATAKADCKSSHDYPTSVVACTDEGDCPAGNLCCVGLGDKDRPITDTVCATSCSDNQYAMCRTGGAPCPSGKSCERITSLDFGGDYAYRLCK